MESKSMSTECPECAAAVSIQGALKGEILTCAECGAELELVEVNPPALALAPQEEEDWGE
jgi:alpha-aminoadipate/glutamate carrier protein LysW